MASGFCESSGMHRNRACPLLLQLRPLDQTYQQKKHYRADDSHHELSDQSVSGKAQQSEYPATKQRADNSDDQVNQDAHAAAFYDLTREKTDEDTDQDFPKQPHSLPPR